VFVMGRSENRRKKKLLVLTSRLCLLSQARRSRKRSRWIRKWITRRYERSISNTLVCEVQMEDESEFRSMFMIITSFSDCSINK